MIRYQDIRDQMDTFDILLFSGEGLISKVIQLASGSKWSHVAIVLRLNSFDELYCYQSTTLSDVPDLTTGARVKGVQLVPLSQQLATYKGEVAWRCIYGNRAPNILMKMAAFRREFAGRPYEQNQLELIRAALDTFTLKENQPDLSSVFCSELIAELFRRVGILQTVVHDGHIKPANEFTPGDFADKLNFNVGFNAGDIVELAPLELEELNVRIA